MADKLTPEQKQMALMDDWRYHHGKPDAKEAAKEVVEREVVQTPKTSPKPPQERQRLYYNTPEVAKLRRDYFRAGPGDYTRPEYLTPAQEAAITQELADATYGPGGTPAWLYPADKGALASIARESFGHPARRYERFNMLEHDPSWGYSDVNEEDARNAGKRPRPQVGEKIDLLKYGLPEGYFGSERHKREELLSRRSGVPLTEEVKIARALAAEMLASGAIDYRAKNMDMANYDGLNSAADLARVSSLGLAALAPFMFGGPF